MAVPQVVGLGFGYGGTVASVVWLGFGAGAEEQFNPRTATGSATVELEAGGVLRLRTKLHAGTVTVKTIPLGSHLNIR